MAGANAQLVEGVGGGREGRGGRGGHIGTGATAGGGGDREEAGAAMTSP